jgi:hypothetical protein
VTSGVNPVRGLSRRLSAAWLLPSVPRGRHVVFFPPAASRWRSSKLLLPEGGESGGVVAESADRGQVAWNYAFNQPANHRTIDLSSAAMETMAMTTAMTESREGDMMR